MFYLPKCTRKTKSDIYECFLHFPYIFIATKSVFRSCDICATHLSNLSDILKKIDEVEPSKLL